MSIIFFNTKGWIISHEQFIKNMYISVKKEDQVLTLTVDKGLFDINSKFVRENQRIALSENAHRIIPAKKKYNTLLENIEEIRKVKKLYADLLNDVNSDLFSNSVTSDFNYAARSLGKTFFEGINCDDLKNLRGCNQCNYSQIVNVHNKEYVFPENSSFYCYDVNDTDKLLEINEQFDLIIMDPPWWNKSVRRKKRKYSSDSYSMLYNNDLLKIPIDKLLKSEGIIAIWCTNSPSCLKSILEELFPKWKVTFKAKWYWVKVTKAGEVICDFNETHNKQPYEILVVGTLSSSLYVENDKILLSVPSAIHSHKPPLTDIFKKILPKNPKCLEIFARYLLPGWHSLGLEVLKFQHLSLYNVQIKTNSESDISKKECK